MNFASQFTKYEIKNFGLVRLPEIKISDEQKKAVGLDRSASNYSFLRKLTYDGLEKKRHLFKKERIKEYTDRIEEELALIQDLAFVDYFLLVWMVVNKMLELGAFRDYSRGSCAASLVFYLTDCTGVDPIDKCLLLSRFISQTRARKQVIDGVTYLQGDLMCDVDINMDNNTRDRVVEWLQDLYPARISKIATLSTLSGKALIKDVYKIMEEVSEEDAKEVADLVERHFGIVDDIADIPAKNKEFAKWANEHKETFEVALKLRDLIRQKSTHASGYLISYSPLAETIPMEISKDGEQVSAYDMNDVCHFTVKLDLLGLNTNEIINDVLKQIPETAAEISLRLDDEKLVYDQFQTGELLPYGLYQVSADCMYRVVSKIKPKNIYELSDCSAIARPGGLGFLEDYTGNKTVCPHPAFENVLKKTRNVCLYQEESIQMAMALGFTASEGETLRRVIGKKKVHEVKEWKEKIYKKCEENGFSKEIGDLFWKIVDDSSKYQFNLSHSISTSYLTALTVYLKYKYPLQFYTSCLRAVKNLQKPTEEIEAIQKELPFFNIKILPPDLLKSGLDFVIEDNNIRFGISHLKGVAEKAIEKLIKFRKPYANKFEVFLAAGEAGVNSAVLSALILSGCLDNISSNRPRLLMEMHLWNCLTDKEKRIAMHYGAEFEYDVLNLIKGLKTKVDDKGKPAIKESRYLTIKKKFKPYWDQYTYNCANEQLAKYFFEKYVLGFSYSVRLIDIYKTYYNDLEDIQTIKSKQKHDRVRLVAEVEFAKEGVAKNEKKTKYVRIGVKDSSGSIVTMMFNTKKRDVIDNCKYENGRLPKSGDIIIVLGNKWNDAIAAEKIWILDIDVYIKIREMNEAIKRKDENSVKIA